jgi:uncharacterized protein YyaL (SSP411 family)
MGQPTKANIAHRYTNHLIGETSPYLLQHAHNPVNWFPWSSEAHEKARNEDKPIFLSIGYAACHWCHVMEEESFEDVEIARILNDHFISIKVDREERPDLDQIYMAAGIAMTGSGGWPMSVFLTPDLKPFFAGTYFPPDDRYGRPGFKRLVTEIAHVYRTERNKIEDFARALVNNLSQSYAGANRTVALDKSIIVRAEEGLLKNYDRVYGGFGGAPKFPHSTELSFLLKGYAWGKNQALLSAIEHSLQSMARGGIYDHLGGGFHRYATDSRWLVPHFEKMLYDNALLADTYAEAFQLTGNQSYRKVSLETLDFILREMTDTSGGFYSSLDADSEGEEGKFYVWAKSEIESLLGENTDIFCRYFNITDTANFEHDTSILNIDSSSCEYRERFLPGQEKFDKIIKHSKQVLLEARSDRPSPFTDDKILTSWNALAISGFAKGYQISRKERYRQTALKAAQFIKDSLYKDAELHHAYRLGRVMDGPFLEDHAYFIQALVDLYEITYDYNWIGLAAKLADDVWRMFSDNRGNLYLSLEGNKDHFMRPRDIADGALPAPGSILIQSLLRLSDITGGTVYRERAEKALAAISGEVAQRPYSFTSAIVALGYLITDRVEIVVVGEEGRDDFLDEIYRKYLPNRVVIVSDKGNENIPLLEGRRGQGKTVAYVCRDFVCRMPVTTPDELRKQLADLE